MKKNQQARYDSGDLGLPGCIQVIESVTAHRWSLAKLDRIFRFAGNTNPKLPWPEDDTSKVLSHILVFSYNNILILLLIVFLKRREKTKCRK